MTNDRTTYEVPLHVRVTKDMAHAIEAYLRHRTGETVSDFVRYAVEREIRRREK